MKVGVSLPRLASKKAWLMRRNLPARDGKRQRHGFYIAGGGGVAAAMAVVPSRATPAVRARGRRAGCAGIRWWARARHLARTAPPPRARNIIPEISRMLAYICARAQNFGYEKRVQRREGR